MGHSVLNIWVCTSLALPKGQLGTPTFTHWVLCTVLFSVFSVQFEVCSSVQYAVCSVKCEMCSVQLSQCHHIKTGLWLGHPGGQTTAISGLSPPQPPIYETIDDTYELGSDYEVIPPPPAPMRTFLPSLVHVRAEGCWGDLHNTQRHCNSLDREGLKNSHRYSPHSFRGPPAV